MKAWKVIYVKSRTEKKIAERLKNKHVDVYLPIRKHLRQWSDRKKTVELPLISGYIFVNINDSERSTILAENGVVKFLRYNSSDATLRDIEIEALKMIEQKDFFISDISEAKLIKGNAAVIKSGIFKGLKGIIQENRGNNTYGLLIEEIDLVFTLQVPQDMLG